MSIVEGFVLIRLDVFVAFLFHVNHTNKSKLLLHIINTQLLETKLSGLILSYNSVQSRRVRLGRLLRLSCPDVDNGLIF